MLINKKINSKVPTPFFLFGKVLHYSSKLHKKKQKYLTLGEKQKSQQHILHT